MTEQQLAQSLAPGLRLGPYEIKAQGEGDLWILEPKAQGVEPRARR